MPRTSRLGPRHLGVALLLLLGSVAPTAALAQGRGRVEEELRRTDEILDRAGEIVRDSDSSRSHDLLEQARRIQTDARGNFNGGRLVQAGRLTLEARTMGARAATLARDDSSLRQRAERELERAGRELARARDALGDSRPEDALGILDQAANLLERARGAFAEQQFQVAIRLALASQRLAAHALVLAGGDVSRRLSVELERTDHLLERLGPRVESSGPPGAVTAFEEARTLQRRAWESVHGGHPREALVLTREARALANRARSLPGVAGDPLVVENALTETDRALERTADVVVGSGSSSAEALLERARSHQERGRAALRVRDLERALAQTRVARNLASRALQMVDAGAE